MARSPGVPGPLVGRGARAEIRAWGDARVVKLFWAGSDPTAAESEARATMSVHEAGLPVPGCFGTVTVEGRPGIVFERLTGPTMLDRLLARPWQAPLQARCMAALHAAIHDLPAPTGVPSLRERLGREIEAADHLAPEVRRAVDLVLRRLPDGDRLLHGDFHPGNIMLTGRGPLVIDWQDTARGNPAADVARTLLLLANAPLHQKGLVHRLTVRVLSGWVSRQYLRCYARLRPLDRREVEAWMMVRAAARLREGIPGEGDWLARLASRALKARVF